MTKLVGIGGLLASGKDTVADYLVEKHGWVKMGMSEPLADALSTLNPWIVVHDDEKEKGREWHTFYAVIESGVPLFPELPKNKLYVKYHDLIDVVGYTQAKEVLEVRRLLQVLGTEVGRDMIGINTWVDIAERRIVEARAEGKSVILTGVRFYNELRMIWQNSGELWWVDRPGLETSTTAAGHASENSVNSDDFGTHITNDGTLEDLYQKVENLIA